MHALRTVFTYSLLLCSCLFMATAWAVNPTTEPELQASVNRDSLSLDETLQLKIRLSGDPQDITKPNFTPLEKDFTIVGTGEHSQVTIINSQSQIVKQWIVSLAPKHTGNITIPSLQVGSLQTRPITVAVTETSEIQDNGALKDIFLQAEVSPDNPYVHAQAIYTVSLYYNKSIENAQFSEPKINHGTIIHLDQDRNYQKRVDEDMYQVLERRYAVFPDQQGDVTIQGPRFSGAVFDTSSLNRNPRAFFNSSWQPVEAAANPVTLQVKPIPANASQDPWLPAETLTLSEEWSEQNPQFQVGQPITRIVTLNAKGLMAEQLPDITPPTTPGFQIYPDKPSSITRVEDNQLSATQVNKIALIPTKAGELTLPAITIQWWNTQTNRPETAAIPAQTINVLPAANPDIRNDVTPPATATPAQEESPTTNTPAVSQPTKDTPYLWMALAAFFFLGWLSTWLFYRRRPRQPKPKSEIDIQHDSSLRKAKGDLKQACQTNNAHRAREKLLLWAQLQWPEQAIRSLGDVAKMISDEDAKNAIVQLDKWLYTEHDDAWQGANFWMAIENSLSHKANAGALHGKSGLPRLYPEA